MTSNSQTLGKGGGGDDHAFIERMEQISLLPEHDPLRQELEREIAARAKVEGDNGPTTVRWRALLAEAQELRAALLSVPVPAQLNDHLLAVRSMPVGSRYTLFTPRVLKTVAAILVLVLAGRIGWTQWTAYKQRQFAAAQHQQMDHVARLAVNLHATLLAGLPAERIDTGDQAAAIDWLKTRLSFPPSMPFGNRGAKLTAASVVKLDNVPAALTTWDKDGHFYSVLEFDPASLNLAADFPNLKEELPPATVTPASPPVAYVYRAAMWSEPRRGCGWVLVMDTDAEEIFVY